jgi:hypothetical protein
MALQLASELDPDAEAGRLARWAASYRGSGGVGGWLAPRREAAEQWRAVIRGVVRVDIDRGDLADPGLLSHRRAVPPAPDAWVSPQRVIISHGRRVLEAWRLDQLSGVHVLDDLTGVVLLATETHADDDQFPALLSDIVPWYTKFSGQAPPGYGKRRVDVDWLKFEAVFAAGRDRLDEWSRDLPSRLARIVRLAQDTPAR